MCIRTGRGAVTAAPGLSFSRHAEVLQALRDPALVSPGQRRVDVAPTQALRAAVAAALSPDVPAAWPVAFAAAAQDLIDALPAAVPVDLVSQLAEPWSLQVALAVTGLPEAQAAAAARHAARLFQSAAQATAGGAAPEALQAAAELQALLAPAARAAGPAPSRWADVQTFVALSQSLPALLANAWHALLDHPADLAGLLADPGRLDAGLDELLRLGSPARAVFREAALDTCVGCTPVATGTAVTLLLWEANRDPDRFVQPERLDLARPGGGQLGLGGGTHACPGARLVRLALRVITQALLSRTQALDRVEAGPAVWRGGHALRWVGELPVRWRPRPRG